MTVCARWSKCDHGDFHWKCLLLLWPWKRSNRSGWCIRGNSSMNVSSIMIKIFQTQRWQFVPLPEVPNVKVFYDCGYLKNMVEVKFMTCKKGLVIMHLGCKYKVLTSNGYWFMDICLSHLLSWKSTTLTHTIQKWGCSDFIKGILSSIHQRCPQIWHGILGPSGLKAIVYSGEHPLIFIENVCCYCDLDRGQTDLVDVL